MGTVFCVYWTSTSLSTSILHIWYVFKQVCTTLATKPTLTDSSNFFFINPPTVAFLFLEFHSASTDATPDFSWKLSNPFIYWISPRELIYLACLKFPGSSWNINFLSTAIHIVAHVFNVEFFISSHASEDQLVQQLNAFEDRDDEAYLNPIRDTNAVRKTFLLLLLFSVLWCTADRCSPPDVPYIVYLFVLFCGTYTQCRLKLKSFYWLFVRFQLWCCGNLVRFCYFVINYKMKVKETASVV